MRLNIELNKLQEEQLNSATVLLGGSTKVEAIRKAITVLHHLLLRRGSSGSVTIKFEDDREEQIIL